MIASYATMVLKGWLLVIVLANPDIDHVTTAWNNKSLCTEAGQQEIIIHGNEIESIKCIEVRR